MAEAITITFEGIDGAGKETQSKLLATYLSDKGLSVHIISFPDYDSLLGEFIKKVLQHSSFDPYALQLLFSADRIHQTRQLQNSSTSYDYIIFDRYKWSSIVYGVARGLDKQWVSTLEKMLPDPDFTFYLDIPVTTSTERTGGSDILERNKVLLQECKMQYDNMAVDLERWHRIDGTQAQQAIHNKVKNIIHEVS